MLFGHVIHVMEIQLNQQLVLKQDHSIDVLNEVKNVFACHQAKVHMQEDCILN